MRVEPCLMMEKIEWYQEVLKLDPDSRVFFPLAQLLRESRQPEKAIDVLRLGLSHTSIFLEARLLLIQLLFEQARVDECRSELSAVTGLLEKYPAFWEVWADSVAEKNKDLALAIRLMASTIRHPEYSLSLILESGLELLQDVRRTFSASAAPVKAGEAASEAPSGAMPCESSGDAVPESSADMPFADEDLLETMLEERAPVEEASSMTEKPLVPLAGEAAFLEESEEPTLRTRSMADVLAEQGDIVGALEIYQELEAAAPTPEEARELHDSVVALAARVAGNGAESEEQAENAGEPPYGDMGNHLMSLLESLADRLEARARA